jgi:hypothetical protein
MLRAGSVVTDEEAQELVRLAGAVQSAVPHDLDQALTCLRIMSLELQVQEERDATPPATAQASFRQAEREKLAGVVAQLECSIATRHVLAVGGLLRQVQKYLTVVRGG